MRPSPRRCSSAAIDVVSLALDKPDWSHPRLEAREVDLFDAKATAEAAAEIASSIDVTHIVHNAGVIRPNAVEADDGRGHRRRWPSFISARR